MHLTDIVVAAIRVYTVLIVVRAIFSWLPERHRQNEFYGFLHVATEPVLEPVRRLIPVVAGLDFSPLAVIILLETIASVLSRYAR